MIQICSLTRLVPKIDLLASRLNYQMRTYVSYRPDPSAKCVDSFTLNWRELDFRAFPPFSLLSSVILGAPFWPARPFFPLLIQVLVDSPVLLPARKHLLRVTSHPGMDHPLHRKLRLLACKVSGKNTWVKAFLKKQPLSSWPGEPALTHTSRAGDGTQRLYHTYI